MRIWQVDRRSWRGNTRKRRWPMIDSHLAPLSSWPDTEQRRGEIRNAVQQTPKEIEAHGF